MPCKQRRPGCFRSFISVKTTEGDLSSGKRLRAMGKGRIMLLK